MTRQGENSLRPSLLLIGLVLLARLVYTVFLCRYDLVEDEAHYWLWARHLDWSYYSKGPGIAWVIWLSTHVLGHAEWAVRLPTVIADAVGAFACAGLARDLARRAFVGDGSVSTPTRAAVFGAAAFLLAPAFQVTGMLVTIDGCYLACWACACWAAWRAFGENSRWAWPVLGLALGLGFLFKYTILLLVPGLVLFAALRRSQFRLAGWWRGGAVMAIAIMLLGLAPVVIWNAREGWPTYHHLLGHLGLKGGDVPLPSEGAGGDAAGGSGGGGGGVKYNPMWTVSYVLAPIGMFGPVLGLGVVAGLRVLRRRQATTETSGSERRLGATFLLCAAAPILAFYLVVSFIAEPEQNWAIGGFVTIVVLAGWYGADEITRRVSGANNPQLTAAPTPRTRVSKVLWRLTIAYGVCAAALLHFADVGAGLVNLLIASPPVTGLVKSVSGSEPRPIAVGRLIGAKVMAAHAGRVLDELDPEAARQYTAKGEAVYRPMLIAEHYGRASQMAYYFFRQGRSVVVLSSQFHMGGRRSQFDLWPETGMRRHDWRGRSALLLSNNKPHTLARWQQMFERVEPLASGVGPEHNKLEGENKKDRVAYLGFGYVGPRSNRADDGNADPSTPQQSTP